MDIIRLSLLCSEPINSFNCYGHVRAKRNIKKDENAQIRSMSTELSVYFILNATSLVQLMKSHVTLEIVILFRFGSCCLLSLRFFLFLLLLITCSLGYCRCARAISCMQYFFSFIFHRVTMHLSMMNVLFGTISVHLIETMTTHLKIASHNKNG